MVLRLVPLRSVPSVLCRFFKLVLTVEANERLFHQSVPLKKPSYVFLGESDMTNCVHGCILCALCQEEELHTLHRHYYWRSVMPKPVTCLPMFLCSQICSMAQTGYS